MDKGSRDSFSVNFFSLQLQLKTLFEGFGGDNTLELLDTLSSLSKSEQEIALKVFKRIAAKILSGEERLSTANDQVLQDFEESLYREVLEGMREAAKAPEQVKLEVLPGGKNQRSIRKAPQLARPQLKKLRKVGEGNAIN